MRPARTLQFQLVRVLVLLALGSTVTLGVSAYFYLRHQIRANALQAVETAADSRKDSLRILVTRQHDRLTVLADTLRTICRLTPDDSVVTDEPGECVRRYLDEYVAVERAHAAVLMSGKWPAVEVGDQPHRLVVAPIPASAAAFANFTRDPHGQVSYIMTAWSGPIVVRVEYEVGPLVAVFQSRYGLGRNGETFLADPSGRFVTPGRYGGEASPR